MLKVMVTGHRPNKLGGYCDSHPMRVYIKDRLFHIMKTFMNADIPLYGISGMAIGVDQDFSKVCIELGIPWDAYVPFKGQEGKWPEASQKEYAEILKKANEVKIVCPGAYSPKKMQLRNMAMVDDCTIGIAVWDGSSGGTQNCVSYIKSVKKPMIHVDPRDHNRR